MVTRKTKHLWMVVGIAALCLAVGVIAVKAGSDIVLANATGQVEVRRHQATTWKSEAIRPLHGRGSVPASPFILGM